MGTRYGILTCWTKCFLKFMPNSICGSRRMIHLKFHRANADYPDVDIYKIRLQCKHNKTAAKNYEEASLDALLREVGFNESLLPMPYIRKRHFMFLDINVLKQDNLIPPSTDVIEKLLSHLEPFPFNRDKVPKYSGLHNPYMTIKRLRDEIEKQYLAWKCEWKPAVVQRMFSCFKGCMTYSRPMSSIRDKTDFINKNPVLKSMNIGSKMYLLTMKPLNKEVIVNFKNNFVGLPWDEVALMSRTFIARPYGTILLFLNALKSKEFTDEQIRAGLPYFRENVPYLIFRLNYIILSPKYSQYRDHEKFLSLMCLSINVIKELEKRDWTDFSECLKYTDWVKNSRTIRMNAIEFYVLLSRHLDITTEDVHLLCQYKKNVESKDIVIEETIQFLKRKFTEEEIKESMAIALYPSHVVEFWLNYIRENSKIIQKAGFKNGFVSDVTNTFVHGTKLPNKTLQLCLYFIDKYQGSHVSPNMNPEEYLNQ